MKSYPKYRDIIGTGSGNSVPVHPEPVPEQEPDDEINIPENIPLLTPAQQLHHMRQLAGLPGSISLIRPMEWHDAYADFTLRRNRPEYTQHILNNTIDEQINNRKENHSRYNRVDLDLPHRRFLSSILSQTPP